MNIHDALKQWGREQQHVPAASDALKNLTMASLPPKKELSDRLRFRLPWFALSMSAVVRMMIITAPTLIRKQLGQATGSVAPANLSTPAATKEAGGDTNFGLECGTATGLGSQESFPKKMYDQFYPPQDSQIPLTDTREFLKTDYSATIKARRANELGTRVALTVRGLGGRVDNSSISDRYAYVSFVIPKDALPVLQSELKGMVNKVFFTESINTVNLLGNKRVIEEQTDSANDRLAIFQNERKQMDSQFRSQINQVEKLIVARRTERLALEQEKTDDPERQAFLTHKITELKKDEQQTLPARLMEIRRQHSAYLKDVDSIIQDIKNNLDGLNREDKQLLDTVETVRGTIALNWISISEYISLLLAPHWWLLPLAALILIVAKVATRKRIPEVPLAPR